MSNTIKLRIPMETALDITDYENPFPFVQIVWDDGFIEIDAAPFGAMCVHPAVYVRNSTLVAMRLYTVSHIESGLALGTFTSEGIAEMCAQVADEALDWAVFWAACKDLDDDARVYWLESTPDVYEKVLAIKRTFAARPEWVRDIDEFTEVYFGEDD